VVLGVSFCFVSCFKKDTGCSYKADTSVATSYDRDSLRKYLDSAGITATLHSSGFYYQILTQGSGTVPGVCSTVEVTYAGTLINGSVFDQQTDALFTLGGLISGWKQGLPLIAKGGHIKLYIPPSLGFGPTPQKDKNGNVIVPPNSIVIFDIDLIDVQ